MPCKVQGSTSRQCHQVSTYNILIISMVTDFTTNTVAIIIIMNITIACQYQTQSCDDWLIIYDPVILEAFLNLNVFQGDDRSAESFLSTAQSQVSLHWQRERSPISNVQILRERSHISNVQILTFQMFRFYDLVGRDFGWPEDWVL